MEYLTKEDIILINKLTIKRHGGNYVPPFNLLNENALDYLIDAVSAEMYGEPIYPTVTDKAAVYMFNTISNHIFQDGNKRTGLEAALLFLKLNDMKLKEDLEKVEMESLKKIPKEGDDSNAILFNFTMEVASGEVSLEECRIWLIENAIKLKNG